MSAAGKADPGWAAFTLCELEWMHARLVAELDGIGLTAFATAVEESSAVAGPDLVARAQEALDDAETLVSMFSQLAVKLPSAGVRATRDDVSAAARAAVEHGFIDWERALHAARWVDVADGLDALARSVATSDCYRFWDVQVEQFVAAFRGADPRLARTIARDAGVVGTMFAELTSQQARQLVVTLRQGT